MSDLSERLLSITGHTDDINEALDEMEFMKIAIAELFDDNQALEIINRRMRLCLTLAQTTIAAIETDVAMFITDKTRNKLNQFNEQLAKLENAIVLSKNHCGKDKMILSIGACNLLPSCAVGENM